MFYGGQRRSGIVLDPFWDPLLSGNRSVLNLEKNKNNFNRTIELLAFGGYPKKSFTADTSVLKMENLEKGGGGTPPHFARNEGIGNASRTSHRLAPR